MGYREDTISYCPLPLACPLSFPYAELPEYHIQNDFGAGFPCDLAEAVQGFLELECKELGVVPVVFEAFYDPADIV